jgi:two-component system, NarL family, response regulator LiaR
MSVNLPTSQSDRLRVMVIEDDPMMLLGLEQSLSSQSQFELVGQAEDGYAGVKMALTLKPDIIVMDIGLPGIDGIAATQQIKAALPQVRVVMLTSHTHTTEVVAALSSGADAYCIKGASIDRLLMAITAAQEGATYLDPQIARQVVEHLKMPVKNPNAANIGTLSQREVDVLKLMVEGLSNPEIGDKLFLSPNTVKTHVRAIMNKLAVDDRVQAAVVALRAGLV